MRRAFGHKSKGPVSGSNHLRGLAFGLVLGVLYTAPGVVVAQTGQGPSHQQVASPVLTLDPEKLFEDTLWGERIRSDMTQASRALSQENDDIADKLVAEEKSLTEKRPTMDADAFRKEADAFDEHATDVRAAQKGKAQALTQRFEDEREAFYTAITPLLDDLLRQRGAQALLDRRTVLRALSDADVTQALVQMVDAHFGDGRSQSTPPNSHPNTSSEPSAIPTQN